MLRFFKGKNHVFKFIIRTLNRQEYSQLMKSQTGNKCYMTFVVCYDFKAKRL